MKNSFKNTFRDRQKILSLAGVSEKWRKLTSTNQKNQFPRAEIRFLLKRLLPPNFKIFNRALNKNCFYQAENLFPPAGMNNSLKIRFHCLEYEVNGKIGFSLARKTVSTRNNEVFL